MKGPRTLGGCSPGPTRPGAWEVCACAQVCVPAQQSADGLGFGATFDALAVERNSGNALRPEAVATGFPGQGSGHLREDQRSWMHSAMTLGRCHQTGPGRGTRSVPLGFYSLHFRLSICPRPQGSRTPEETTFSAPQGGPAPTRHCPQYPATACLTLGLCCVPSSLTCCHGAPLLRSPLSPGGTADPTFPPDHPGLCPLTAPRTTDIVPISPRRPRQCLSLKTVPTWLPARLVSALNSQPSCPLQCPPRYQPTQTGLSKTDHCTPLPGPAAASRTSPHTQAFCRARGNYTVQG